MEIPPMARPGAAAGQPKTTLHLRHKLAYKKIFVKNVAVAPN